MYFFIVTFLLVLFSSNAVGMTISKELQEWLDASDRSASAAPLSIHDEALRQFQELSYRTISEGYLPKFESLLGQLIEIHGCNPIGEDQNTLLHWICIILTPQAGSHGPYLQYVDDYTVNEIIKITRRNFPNIKELLSLRNKRRETPLDCIRVASIMGDNTPGENLAKKVYGLLTAEPSP
jgi:hypothetical protein